MFQGSGTKKRASLDAQKRASVQAQPPSSRPLVVRQPLLCRTFVQFLSQTTRVAGIYTYMQVFYLQILLPGIVNSNQARMVWHELSMFSLFFVFLVFWKCRKSWAVFGMAIPIWTSAKLPTGGSVLSDASIDAGTCDTSKVPQTWFQGSANKTNTLEIEQSGTSSMNCPPQRGII